MGELASGGKGWGVKVGTPLVITSHYSHLDVVVEKAMATHSSPLARKMP